HASAVLEGHGILEARATAADNRQAQSRWNRRLLRHDLFNLGNGARGKNRSRSFWLLHFRGRGQGGGCHQFNLLDFSIITKLESDSAKLFRAGYRLVMC